MGAVKSRMFWGWNKRILWTNFYIVNVSAQNFSPKNPLSTYRYLFHKESSPDVNPVEKGTIRMCTFLLDQVFPDWCNLQYWQLNPRINITVVQFSYHCYLVILIQIHIEKGGNILYFAVSRVYRILRTCTHLRAHPIYNVLKTSKKCTFCLNGFHSRFI